jgi:hypothetical protein
VIAFAATPVNGMSPPATYAMTLLDPHHLDGSHASGKQTLRGIAARLLRGLSAEDGPWA